MKQKLAIYAGLLAIGIAAAGPATSQVLPYPPPGNMLPYPAANNLPPHEVVALVRSTGLEPLTRPVRHGPVFILHAANKAGHEVRVVVDARLGRIVRVVPLGTVRQAAAVPPPPAPYGRPPAGIPSVPDGYGPSGRATGLPSDIEDAEPYGQVAGIGTACRHRPAVRLLPTRARLQHSPVLRRCRGRGPKLLPPNRSRPYRLRLLPARPRPRLRRRAVCPRSRPPVQPQRLRRCRPSRFTRNTSRQAAAGPRPRRVARYRRSK